MAVGGGGGTVGGFVLSKAQWHRGCSVVVWLCNAVAGHNQPSQNGFLPLRCLCFAGEGAVLAAECATGSQSSDDTGQYFAVE